MQFQSTHARRPSASVAFARQAAGALCVLLSLFSLSARADLILDETADAQALAERVMSTDNGNVVINSVTMVGAAGQSATFTNGLSVPGFFDSDRGIVLSSGEVSDIAGPNANDETSNRMPFVAGSDGDPDFDALSTSSDGTFDAVYIVIDFTPLGDRVSGTFVFSSEEYNEYAPPDGAASAGNEFFDVMGFFVNGVNYSTNADGSDVSINTVNRTLNSSDYIDNDFGDFGGATPFDIEPDGFTRRLTWIAPVNPGVSNTLKFGVADGGDDDLDSWLLVDENSFRIFDDPADVDLALSVSDSRVQVVPGQVPQVETVVRNLGPARTGREMIVDHVLPAGVTVNGGAASAIGEQGINGDEWICVSDAATPQGVQCRSVTALGSTPGNDASVFTFDLDAVDAGLVGETLVLTATVSSGDNDSTTANDSASDSTDVSANDTVPPAAVFEGLPSITGSLTTFPATLRFDEAVSGLSVIDVLVVNAAVTNFTVVDATTATFDLTPDGNGDVQAVLPANAVQDAAGNGNASVGPVVTVYDVDSPLLEIRDMPGVVADDTPFDVRLVFSEPVTGFELGDIRVSNGAPSDLVMLDGASWTVTINPDTTGDVVLSVAAGAAQALDDGVDSSGDSASATFNASAPTVTLSGAPAAVNSLDPWTVTLAFDEPVSGLAASDIAVANATLGPLQTVSASRYTITVTPDGSGDVSFSLPEGSVDDVAAGNPNPPSPVLLTRYDAVAPTASFSNAPAFANSTSTYTVNLVFDEAVSGLELSDIVASNATLGNLTSSDDMAFAFNVTPDGSGDVVLSLAAAAAADEANNGNDAVTSVTTVYDDEPPAEPAVVPLTTNDTTPELGGSADLSPGNSLQVSIAGVDYQPGDGALVDNGDGTWSLVIPPANALSDGVFDVTVSLTDAAGNSAVESAGGELTIDTVPPPAPTVAPDLFAADDNGSSSSDDLTNVANARFTAPTGTFAAGDSIRLFADGVLIGSDLVSADGSVSVAAGSLSEGLQSVTFTAVDAAGNESAASAALGVTLDTTFPVPTLDTPIAGDDIINAAESSGFSLSGTSEPGGTVQVSIVDGISALSATASVDGAGVWSLSGLDVGAFADGPLLVDVIGTDAAGNVAAGTSAPVTLDTVGSAAPVVVEQTTSNTTPSVVIMAALGPGETLDVELDGIVYSAPSGSLVDDGSGGWVLTVDAGDALEDGSYQVVAIVTDADGNTSVDTSVDDLVIDTIDPATPAIDALVSNTATPTIGGDAVLAAGESLTVTLDGVDYSSGDGTITVESGDRWTLVVAAANALADGTFDIVATTRDAAGNTSSDVTASDLLVDTVAPAAPVVNALQTNDTAPTLGGTASTGGGEVLSVIVDGVTYVVGEGDLSIDGDGNWTLVIPPANALDEGIYDVTAVVTDSAGNSSSETTSGELAIDTTPPATPTLLVSLDAASDSGSDDADGVTNVATVDLVLPPGSLDPGDLLTLFIDGAVAGTATADADGSVQIDDAPLVEGEQSLTYVVTDGAGNDSPSSPAEVVTLDTLAPTPALASPIATDGNINAEEAGALVLSGSSDPGSLVDVSVSDGSDTVRATAVADAAGEWAVEGFDIRGLADGPLTIDVLSTDIAGNIGAGNSENATLDATGPVAPTVVPLTSNSTTPTLTGTTIGENGETLTVIVNGISYVAGGPDLTIDGDGNWTLVIPPADALDEGSYDVTAVVTDAAGNATTETAGGGLTIDLTTPLAPIVAPQLASGSDSGASDSDGVTAQSAVDIVLPAGSLEPGDVVSFTLDGVEVATSTVAGDGSVTSEAIDLVEGLQTLRYTVTDVAGNRSDESPALDIVLDTERPRPTVIAPVAGDGVVNAAESRDFALAGTSEPESTVEVVIDDGNESVVTTVVANARGEWRIGNVNLEMLEDGPLDIVVSSTDLASNVGVLSVSTVTLDTVGPVVPVVIAQSTGNTTPTVAFEVVVGSGETLVAVLDGVTYSSSDSGLVRDADGTWTLTVAAEDALSGGVYDLDVTLTDIDGNSSTDLSSDELEIDLSVPEVTAMHVSPAWDDTPRFEGGSDQPDGAIIRVIGSDGTLCTATVSAGQWACEATEPLGNGSQAIIVISDDGFGNASDVSVTLVIDTVLDSDVDGITDLVEGADQRPPRDTDADGVPDHLDPDSDADGIDDSIEGADDSDDDGVPDYLDNDSDGDGVPDVSEQALDTDGDGVADYLDLDSDGDGISDAVEGNVDSDADGIPDSRDLDSDGDLIPDALERGALEDDELMTDSPRDSDGDGLADYIDSDSDDDGVLDLVEAEIDVTLGDRARPRDSDGDGRPDHLDSDSDNDGVPDVVEGSEDSDGDGVADRRDDDSNNDGIPDNLVGTGDMDRDGIPDRLDGDLDNDGIPNIVEGIDDSDGDGIFDFLDPESDGDGIDDIVEGSIDTDGDGLGNWRDSDSDGDGIGDLLEGVADADGDGVANYIDLDSDGDGVRDLIEGALDADGDGVPNRLDGDSDDDERDDLIEGEQDTDADGIADFLDPDSDGSGDGSDGEGTEAGEDDTDTDGDGVPDVRDDDDDGDGISDLSEAGVDTDEDGVPDSLDTDSDGDGIDDALEGSGDVDGDGVPDFRDTDSDNDAISDREEGLLDSDADGTPDFKDADSDGDGLPDRLETNRDSDGDGVPDYLDLDADDDGLSDADEGAVDTDDDGRRDALDTDSDGDGIADSIEGRRDTDGDGVDDYRDTDSDADGISDRVEGNVDTDGDGAADYRDGDSDGDGIEDSREADVDSDADGLVDRIDTDSDDDGRADAIEGLIDTDGDGVANYLDLDSDDDTLADSFEGDRDTDGDGAPDALDLDADNDGLLDAFESVRSQRAPREASTSGLLLDDEPTLQTSAYDRDGDGLPDHRDLDSDNDSITDAVEADGFDADSDGRSDDFTDANGNGWDDAVEASPLTPPDTDSDGLPDFRDADSDQDGLADIREVLVTDADGDGIVDDFTDEDGDGLDDALKLAPAELVDSDADGLPDFREVDSDNDGRSDLIESGRVDIDGDGLADSLRDSDADGIPDSVDVDFTLGSDADADGIDDSADSDFVEGPDRDFDGIVDARDPDADNDGFADDIGPGFSAALPDSDNDGVPDYQQPLPGALVQTSVDGHGAGCSIAAPGARSATGRDPVFLILAALALIGLSRRSSPMRDRLSRLHYGLRYRCWRGALLLVVLLGGGVAEADPYKKRFYAGIGAGGSILAPVTDETGLRLENDSAAAVHLHLGLDFHRRFSGELVLGSLGTATLAPDGEIAYSVVGVSALLYHAFEPRDLPRRRGLLGYLRAGIGALNTDASGLEIEQLNPVHLALGLGLEYARPNGLAIRGELLSYDGDARAIQLALLWRFKQRGESEWPDSVDNKTGTARGSESPSAEGTGKSTGPQVIRPTVDSSRALPGSTSGAAPKPTPKASSRVAPEAAPKAAPKADPKANTNRNPEVPAEASVESSDEAVPMVVPRRPTRLADSDRDGVEDRRDACPDSRTDRPTNARGCELLDGVVAGVDFVVGSATLTRGARRVLDEVARALVEFPALTVAVDTHTDDSLGPAEAVELTRQQVKSVARYLLQRGVTRAQLKARAFGSRKPLVEDEGEAGRARNRRVEMRILDGP